MTKKWAVCDTSILILLLDNTNDPETQRRRSFVEFHIDELNRQDASWVIPTPVVAELGGRGAKGSAVVRELARDVFTTVRVEMLDEDAADLAGEISKMTLAARAGRERGAVKVDSFIAGIAHRMNARWLLTANPSDMRSALQAISSPVQLVVADLQPQVGQQVLATFLAKP